MYNGSLNSTHLKKIKINHFLIIIIPLILSSFTHIWNVSQFPAFHPDEGVYIKRALHILNGNGLHDPSSSFDHSQDSTSSFDHPYFGQIFLAGIFWLIGYPDFLNTNSDVESIEKLYSVPRIIIGIISVIDTYLIYRITDRRFNKHMAFFAAILFAVMPLTWFTRRIVLDSIMLPFILTSILLAIEIRYTTPSKTKIFVVLSGLFLGLAIFTKIPSFTLIPLIGFLIYQNLFYNYNKNVEKERIKDNYNKSWIQKKNILKILCLWLIPIIAIPIIWPVYAIATDRFDEFVDGVVWQGTERKDRGKSLYDIVDSFWKNDPLLFIMGIIGIIYCSIKRELMPLIWIAPYIFFLYFIGWVTHFHLILIIPALCIAISKIIYDIAQDKRIRKKNLVISYGIISIITIFGLVSTTLMISVDLSYVQIHAISFITNKIDNKNNEDFSNDTKLHNNEDITIISSPISSWIYKYVFDHEKTFSHVRDTQPITTSKVILLVDSTYKHVISKVEGENLTQIDRLNKIYNNTNIIALFKDDRSNYDRKVYPYTGFSSANIGSRTEEIRSNY